MSTLKIRNLRFCEDSIEDSPEITGGYSLGVYRGRKFYGTAGSKSGKVAAKAVVAEAPTAPVVEPSATVQTTEKFSERGAFSVTKGTLNSSGTLSFGSGV
jgi:hypothetical protein